MLSCTLINYLQNENNFVLKKTKTGITIKLHILRKCNPVTNVRAKLNSGQCKEFNPPCSFCVSVTWKMLLKRSF